jgi:hypothetical protein
MRRSLAVERRRPGVASWAERDAIIASLVVGDGTARSDRLAALLDLRRLHDDAGVLELLVASLAPRPRARRRRAARGRR